MIRDVRWGFLEGVSHQIALKKKTIFWFNKMYKATLIFNYNSYTLYDKSLLSFDDNSVFSAEGRNAATLQVHEYGWK